MNIRPMIRKASGESQPFSVEKLKESLKRSGANTNTINDIAIEIENWIVNEIKKQAAKDSEKGIIHEKPSEFYAIPSRTIYKKAFSLLNRKTVSSAARYKLKDALMEMGPTGHPFEFFTGEVYKALGYATQVSITLNGKCVTHEVDVIATKDKHQRYIECKYYQSTGKNANVQVPLYIHSRVEDIIHMKKADPQFNDFTFSGGIVTNTRFTSDAEAYGKCCGLHLLSWDYPKGNGLKDIIDREKIYPITSLSSLTKAQKATLMERGVVICRQVSQNEAELNALNLTKNRRRKVLEELHDLISNGYK
ncbi:MAG: restriction endonuclease [Bacteroidales bacterium]|nr:restriction endonuclease [Bacteroidales bacterium]